MQLACVVARAFLRTAGVLALPQQCGYQLFLGTGGRARAARLALHAAKRGPLTHCLVRAVMQCGLGMPADLRLLEPCRGSALRAKLPGAL